MRAVSIGPLIIAAGTFGFLIAGCPADPNLPLPYAPNPTPPASPEVLAMEQRAHTLINDERVHDGAPPLVMRDDLRRVARAHSEDMIARDFFDHTNPDGDSPWDRLRDAGISWNGAGENIAWNNFPNQAEVAINGWMGSTGHRNNILNPGFTHTGMGVAFDGASGAYFTQVFISTSKDLPFFQIETTRLQRQPRRNPQRRLDAES